MHVHVYLSCRILNLVHDVDKSEAEVLQCCAHHLKRLAQYNSAAEVLEKLGDINALASLHIETQQWSYVRFAATIILCAVSAPVYSYIHTCSLLAVLCLTKLQAFELAKNHPEYKVHCNRTLYRIIIIKYTSTTYNSCITS